MTVWPGGRRTRNWSPATHKLLDPGRLGLEPGGGDQTAGARLFGRQRRGPIPINFIFERGRQHPGLAWPQGHAKAAEGELIFAVGQAAVRLDAVEDVVVPSADGLELAAAGQQAEAGVGRVNQDAAIDRRGLRLPPAVGLHVCVAVGDHRQHVELGRAGGAVQGVGT